MMNIRITVISMMMLAGAVFGNAVFEGFETYTPGTSINNQGDFTTVNGSSQQLAVISTNTASFFNGGSQSLRYLDNDTSSLASFSVNYNPVVSPAGGPLVVSFDFKIINGVWNPTFWARDAGGTAAITLKFYDQTTATMGNNANNAGLVDVSSYALSTDLWYRAEITIGDISGSSDTYDLRVLEEDGGTGTEVINVTGLGFRYDVSDISSFAFNAGGAIAGRSGTEYYIDNINVIPEPATLGMLGAGFGGLFLLRHRICSK
ncbi:MAG: PEP-CTERM sorting domain-containing protein [Kiritimatiellales bacterium]